MKNKAPLSLVLDMALVDYITTASSIEQDFDCVRHMFIQPNESNSGNILDALLTPEAMVVINKMVAAAKAISKEKYQLRVFTMALLRHLVRVPEDDRQSFLVEADAMVKNSVPAPLRGLVDHARQIEFQPHVMSTKEIQLKALKNVLVVLFTTVKIRHSDLPDELLRTNSAKISRCERDKYRPARSYMLPRMSATLLKKTWYVLHPFSTDLNLKRRRESEETHPSKRSKKSH